MHAVCQNLSTEEEVENVADIGFDCSMCRPYMPTSNGKEAIPAVSVPWSSLGPADHGQSVGFPLRLFGFCETIIWTNIFWKISHCFL